MKRSVFVSIFLITTFLVARDNPFKPVVSSDTMGKATNIQSQLSYLKMEKLKLPSSARVLKKVTFKILNVDGSVQDISYDINKKVDWHKGIILSNSPIKTVQKSVKKVESPKEIKVFKFLSFVIDKNRIFIKNSDKMIREMFFSKPYKIAIDFQRKVAFYTKKIKLKKAPFKGIVVGNHGSFYRVVISLDGDYRYKIQKKPNGYLVELF